MTEDEEKREENTPDGYIAPPIDLLTDREENVGISAEESENTQRAIVDTLSTFHIDVTIKQVISGPVFTRYDLDLPWDVDFSKIIRYKSELAMAIRRGITINIYPNYLARTISIEVPNSKRSIVGLKQLLRSPAYQNAAAGSLMFAVGMDAECKPIVEDLCKMPHMLVAGTTGSGKSVFLHEMIVSLIMKYSPEELRLILVDPKYTEFAIYKGLPHLMIDEIIADAPQVVVALNWAIAEMQRRYTLFAQMQEKRMPVRNIDDYNRLVEKKEDKLPKIVIVVDELADLMAVAKSDIENRVGRIAAKARAAGIHLVFATQRPSVNVITGVIKANLSARVALRVSAEVDSRVIMDMTGAEDLLGKGDLLYKTGNMYAPERAQCAWIDIQEIQKICDFIREHNKGNYKNYSEEDILKMIESSEEKKESSGGVLSIIQEVSKLFGFSSVEEKTCTSAFGSSVCYYVSVPQKVSMETIKSFKTVLGNVLTMDDINILPNEENGDYVIELKNCSLTSVTKDIMSLRGDEKSAEEGIEPVYMDALRYVVKTGNASISMIQRKCCIGFNKAGKIVDWMEQNGYISDFDSNVKSRRVLLTKEEFIEKFGEL
jgi:S-DNA-T family DNA segregation ATPase FtsK/SpoIIIE